VSQVVYILAKFDGHFLGVFSTPEKAMEAVYLSDVYQVHWRGYDWKVRPMVWMQELGHLWYGWERDRLPDNRQKKIAYKIVAQDVDYAIPCQEEIVETHCNYAQYITVLKHERLGGSRESICDC
jgi:hypothetical protein